MSSQSAARDPNTSAGSPSSIATQPLEEEELFDYESDRDDVAAAAAAAPPPITEPPIPPGSILKGRSMTPKDVAGRYVEYFTRSLLWDSQKSAYHDISSNCLQMLGHWFNEEQNIKKAEALVAYIPTGCRVTDSFLQVSDEARERFSERTRLLATEVADHADRVSLERGSFQIRQKKLNNDASKAKLIDYVAESLVRISNIFLEEIHGTLYNPHNLVADMLLIDHTVITKYVCPLEELITAYKRVHKCGREPEDWNLLLARRFPSSAGLNSSGPKQGSASDRSTATIDAAAIAAAHMVPQSASNKPHTVSANTSRTLQFNSSGDNTSVSQGAKITGTPSNAARESLALALAAGQRDSATIQNLLANDPKLNDLFLHGQTLLAQEGGLISKVASRIVDGLASEEQLETPVKQKPSKPPLASPQLIYNHYKKEYRFTRDDTPEELEMWERCLNDALRMEKCKEDCLINSIRPGNFELESDRAAQAGLHPPPDNGPPPNFANLANNTDANAALAAKAREYDQIPLVKLSETATTFKDHAFRLFCGAFKTYMNQSSINRTNQAISAGESKYRKQKAGASTSAIMLKQPSNAKGPVLESVVVEKTRKETKSQLKKVEVNMDSLKRNYETLQKQLANEKAKRKKLEKQIKEHQAPVEEGASQINTPSEVPQETSTINPQYQHRSKRKKLHTTHFRTAGAGRAIYHHRGNPQGGRKGGRIPYNNHYHPNEEADVAFSGRGGRGRGGREQDFRPPLKGRGHPSYQRRSNGKR
eukprot:scaffold21239_cov59-Cyclotella_meneghiniana.AAC.2